jgi:hypothetical protein
MSSAPVTGLIKEVTALLEKHTVKGLIVDVRFNTGGDAGVSSPLVEALTPRLKGMPVIVLTSRTTFSAGITLAAQLKQQANASVVGEPVGDNLDLWSEGGNLLLPNSGLTVHYANGFHAYSQKEYPAFRPYFSDLNVATLMPHHVVEPTWSQYRQGEDPVLEAALLFLKNKRAHTTSKDSPAALFSATIFTFLSSDLSRPKNLAISTI